MPEFKPVIKMPKCARTACENEAYLLLQHKDTGAPYCVSCARRINETSPGMIPWPSEHFFDKYENAIFMLDELGLIVTDEAGRLAGRSHF